MGNEQMQIGEIARMTGKTIRTIRYYEELGLLEPREHTEGGFRLYAPEDVEKIEMIAQLRELGLSLEEIGKVFGAWGGKRTGNDTARVFTALMGQGLDKVQRKIGVLRELERRMKESVTFVKGCCGCRETPAVERCEECATADGRRALPAMIGTIMK